MVMKDVTDILGESHKVGFFLVTWKNWNTDVPLIKDSAIQHAECSYPSSCLPVPRCYNSSQEVQLNNTSCNLLSEYGNCLSPFVSKAEIPFYLQHLQGLQLQLQRKKMKHTNIDSYLHILLHIPRAWVTETYKNLHALDQCRTATTVQRTCGSMLFPALTLAMASFVW